VTPEQKRMIEALSGCRFGVGSFDKRFVRDMAFVLAHKPETELTLRQEWFLRRTFWRYRRQLRQPNMPKPDDYDTPPIKPSTVAEIEREGLEDTAKWLRPSALERRQMRDRERLARWNAAAPDAGGEGA
jgi:hypothetical protein